LQCTGEYDTDRLDPAQRDRFHIQVEVPFKCDREYFTSKYGSDTARAAIQYWDELPDKVRNGFSPRRLDYALEVWNDGGDVRDVIPRDANVQKLTGILRTGPAESRLEKLLSDPVKATEFFKDENNYNSTINTVVKVGKFRDALLPLIPREKMAALFLRDVAARRAIIEDLKDKGEASNFAPVLREVVKAGLNQGELTVIRRAMQQANVDPDGKSKATAAAAGANAGATSTAADVNAPLTPDQQKFDSTLSQLLIGDTATTMGRKTAYEGMERVFPSKLTVAQAKRVLELSEKLCNSYTSTIRRDMPRLVEFLERSVMALKEGGMTEGYTSNLVTGYRSVSRFLRQVQAKTVHDLYR
jgi:hypothetical protein